MKEGWWWCTSNAQKHAPNWPICGPGPCVSFLFQLQNCYNMYKEFHNDGFKAIMSVIKWYHATNLTGSMPRDYMAPKQNRSSWLSFRIDLHYLILSPMILLSCHIAGTFVHMLFCIRIHWHDTYCPLFQMIYRYMYLPIYHISPFSPLVAPMRRLNKFLSPITWCYHAKLPFWVVLY